MQISSTCGLQSSQGKRYQDTMVMAALQPINKPEKDSGMDSNTQTHAEK